MVRALADGVILILIAILVILTFFKFVELSLQEVIWSLLVALLLLDKHLRV